MCYRNTASFGKRQEIAVVGELLRRGFDVYQTLVDDQGIDCVVRLDERRYIDVQIKARSKHAMQWSAFAAMAFAPRKNLFFIFYTEKNRTFWIMPSEDVAEECHLNFEGKHSGRWTLVLPKVATGAKAARFARYAGDSGFGLLWEFKP